MLGKDFPVTKNDIHYNPETQEVTLKREKFDAVVDYVRSLVEQLAATEDDRDIAQYGIRRARTSEKVLQEILKDTIAAVSQSVSQWLESHSIRELSKRTGIPYATCYRIVNERIGTLQMDVGDLAKVIRAVEGNSESADSPSSVPVRSGITRALVNKLKKVREHLKDSAGKEVKGTSSGSFEDKVLKCIDCGADFVFTAGEQFFSYDKQFKNAPRRCRSCIAKQASVLGSPEEQHDLGKLGGTKNSGEEKKRGRDAKAVQRGTEKVDPDYNARMAALYREIVLKEKPVVPEKDFIPPGALTTPANSGAPRESESTSQLRKRKG